MNCFSFSLKKNGIRSRYRGMADSASYADCKEGATPQRSRGARANEHVTPSKPRGDTARTNSENILRISRARPGRRPVRLETCWPGRAHVAWDWNLTDQVGLGPVIRKYHPLGRARVGPGAVGPARLDPTSESWPHPPKPLDLKYCFFYNLKISRNVTQT